MSSEKSKKENYNGAVEAPTKITRSTEGPKVTEAYGAPAKIRKDPKDK